ncbi:hypothetical protein J4231_03345 [Candidatus Woesearchaeota archaeon]|nr:hypothetical protein [Candidatus Woesearchaeota archaeon]
MDKREAIIRKIAEFYDDPRKAYELLTKYFSIEYLEGGKLYAFALACEMAYARRKEHGVQHSTDLLKNDIKALAEDNTASRTSDDSGNKHIKRKPGLDQIELDHLDFIYDNEEYTNN